MNSFPPSQHHSFAATSQTYASALISSTPSLSPKYNKNKKYNNKNNNKKHTSWADQVDDDNNNTQNKKQKLNQIMNWPKSKNNNNTNKRPQLQARKNNYTYQHKDGDKQNKVWELAQRVEDEERKKKDIMLAVHIQQNNNNTDNKNNNEINNRGEIDNFGDSLSSISCDSYSTISGDSMSCESLGGERERETETDNQQHQQEGEEGGEKKKKKKKNKKRKRKYSAAEEGKKVFVGGITFEECDSFITKENETLSSIRYKKFSQIFYLFGSINRIQGHWESGYCFVVFSKRRDAKLAIKCLSMAKVRRKVVQNLRDNIAPAGVLPLPSFYVRWANNPNSSSSLSPSLSSSLSSSTPSLPSSSLSSSIPSNLGDTKQQENGEMKERDENTEIEDETKEKERDREMEWIHTMNEEEMMEEDVERLMRELLKLHNN